MKIAVTGTPGTGKTTLSHLYEQEGLKAIHLTEYVKKKGLGEEGEKEFEVDVEEMREALKNEEFDLLEGHLAHHVPVDICIILRTRPDKLRERLNDRDYSDEKVEENVQSEILDVVLSEAIEEQETVVEVDTTEKGPEEVFEEVKRKVEKGESDYGKFDWTEYL
ncbi:MAG: adenylate kinase family protein [Candidatus Nanohalobium sp.]